MNATLSLADGRYSINGYVRNVTNERFKIFQPGVETVVDSIGPTVLPNGVGSSVTLSDPRTYGLVVSARF